MFGEKQGGRKQKQHEYLYWEDRNSCAVRMNNWKAIRPTNESPFELYDLSNDLEELNDIAAQHPDLLEKINRIAKEAHTPPRSGKVLDPSRGFKGHAKD